MTAPWTSAIGGESSLPSAPATRMTLPKRIFLEPDPTLIVSQNVLLHECHTSVCLACLELSRGIYEWGFLRIFFTFLKCLALFWILEQILPVENTELS